MPEGPSIVIAKEELQVFVRKKVLSASGYSKINKDIFKNQTITDIRSWGKHLLICFKKFTIKVHFLMFGKYLINEQKSVNPVLSLRFSGKKELNIYTSAITLIEQPLDEVYDWSADIMNDAWDAGAARKKIKALPDMIMADLLLDQTVFAGSGNIIKNEVLYRIKVHPQTKVINLPATKLTALIKATREYAFDFLAWRKEGTLKKHWLAHTKKICSRDGTKFTKLYMGKTKRRTFFCEACQVKY